jgi:hypothetical protein
VHFERADQLLERPENSRLDPRHDTVIRKLTGVGLLALDDLCLQALDATDTADLYEAVVERHRQASTVATSKRELVEWLAVMADGLLARSDIEWLRSSAYEVVLDAASYRCRQKPAPGRPPRPPPAHRRGRTRRPRLPPSSTPRRRCRHPGPGPMPTDGEVVPSRW